MKWNQETPKHYYYVAALFNAKFYGYSSWTVNGSELSFIISVNDVFVPAADAQEVEPEEIDQYYDLLCIDDNELNGYDRVIELIRTKRGYTQ